MNRETSEWVAKSLFTNSLLSLFYRNEQYRVVVYYAFLFSLVCLPVRILYQTSFHTILIAAFDLIFGVLCIGLILQPNRLNLGADSLIHPKHMLWQQFMQKIMPIRFFAGWFPTNPFNYFHDMPFINRRKGDFLL